MNLSDLSPDALAKLEAKLLADVAVVRRMRVLMEEHQGLLRGNSGGPAAPIASVAAPVGGVPAGSAVSLLPAVPAAPRKSFDELGWECVQGLPEAGFVMDDLRKKLRTPSWNPSDASLKTLVNRLIRQGKVVVHELKRGRGGSTYRCTVLKAEKMEEASVSPESAPETAV